VKTFDGEFDVARQLGLYQTIIDSGEYNAIVTLPLGGDQDCEILSKTAPEKGIVVSILNTPICGHEFASAKGDGLWAEGTLDTVGVVFNRNGLDAWGKACASYTGGGKAILLNGQAGTPNFETLTKGFEAGGFELVSNYATDYLASEAVEKTNAALLAHPDLNVIATTAPQMTEGAIQALKSSGKQPGVDVKVCNILGGSETMIDLVKSGEVTVDAYANDGWSAIAATQSIIDAAEGRPAPRVIVPGQDGKIVKSGTVPWPPVYTEESANRYEPNGE
jgi:ribose transport system substrate-binding protein